MSVSSFPRPEHVALLRQNIEAWLRHRNLPLEVAARGLNQLKCQYIFGFRRAQVVSLDQKSDASESWAELPIHFQIAQRLEKGRDEGELDNLLDRFFSRFGNSGGGRPAG